MNIKTTKTGTLVNFFFEHTYLGYAFKDQKNNVYIFTFNHQIDIWTGIMVESIANKLKELDKENESTTIEVEDKRGNGHC